MANTYSQVYIHTVFAVKYRSAVIGDAWRHRFLRIIGGLINESGCKTIVVNGVADHVHCLLGLKPVVSIADLLRSVKAKSSKYVNEQRLTRGRFEWQEGYGVFSYSHSQLDTVSANVVNQEEHHKRYSFLEEYLALLKELSVQYDERYIFKDLV